MSEPVAVERDAGVAVVSLDRPARLNALDLQTILLLKSHLQSLAHDADVVGVVLAGRGRAFCAGGDLEWASAYPGGMGPALHVLAGEFHQAICEIREMAKPVIAAVSGVAAGGGFSLCLACDFRVLSTKATLRQAYTSAGLSMDGGSSFMLPRLIGQARAMEIAAFDEPISAERALTLGLATEVTEGDAIAAARSMAQRLAKRSLASFAASKWLFNQSYESPLQVQLARERHGIVACASASEGQEGVRAFLEKRPADFVGARSARTAMKGER